MDFDNAVGDLREENSAIKRKFELEKEDFISVRIFIILFVEY